MKFEFATAGRILFGTGTSRQIPTLAKSLGDAALLVVGRSGRGKDALAAGLAEAGVRSVPFPVDGEPTVGLVDAAKDLALEEGCQMVIALGGGSVIDAGKAVAGMLTNPGNVMDYLEVVGGGRPILRPAAPWIAVPTTAGTGAEATRNAVLDVPERRVKVSLRGHHLLATIAVIDPELTLSLPPAITAYTGLDALTQLIEPFVSVAANPLTDGVCREGLALAARSLAAACRDGADIIARTDMSAAALMSGIALANARLGTVHGFASVLGGTTGHPHGALCARLLPFVIETNLRALAQRPVPGALDRYTEVARRLTGDPGATAEDGLTWVRSLCTELAIPPLRASGLTRSDFGHVIPATQRASSTQGNPVKLTDDELAAILEAAIG
ncbi:MAG: iron-containing alcohol dehydrogenase [Isosphaeraceae bacterium]